VYSPFAASTAQKLSVAQAVVLTVSVVPATAAICHAAELAGAEVVNTLPASSPAAQNVVVG
jgi:hypothetical protein